MTWYRWLWIVLIVLGSLTTDPAGMARTQAPADSPAPQADPDDAAQVALGQQVYASFCAGCHGDNLEGQPNWRQRLPLGNFPARRTTRAATPGTMPTSGCSRSSSTAANITLPRAIVAPCRPTETCSWTPSSGPCGPSLTMLGRNSLAMVRMWSRSGAPDGVQWERDSH
jgi:cytochrome c5